MKITGKMQTKLYLDIILVAVYLIIMEPLFTGLKWHEWIGLALGLAFITHIILNWKWVTACTKKFFKKMSPRLRVNYIINFLLLIAAIFLLLSSLAIAKYIDFSWFSWIGLYYTFTWLKVHVASSFVLLFIGAIHLGLHWKWIMTSLRQTFQFTYKLPNYLTSIFAIAIVALGIFAAQAVDLFVTLERAFTIFDLTNLNSTSLEPTKVHGKGSGGGGGKGLHSITETTTSISILVYIAVAAMIAVITRYIDLAISRIWRQGRRGSKKQSA